MTESLYLIFETQSDCNLSADSLVKTIQSKCAAEIPSNVIQHFRVIWSQTGNKIKIQPFIGGSSFMNLYESKKRPYINTLLLYLFEWIKEFSNRIEILFYTEDAKELVQIESFSGIEDILSKEKKPHHTKFTFSPKSKIFYIGLAQANLETPLNVKTTEPATGYFCHYYVVASNVEEAINYITTDMEKERAFLVGYESLVEILYSNIPDEVKELSEYSGKRGIFYRSGRVYFS
ncbi:hypothetical protein [Spirulina sp. 06S082]|uniref:hypothetical protein n=1 Tax=Spirulina sp. 06S082 TaxID=3110248 RepID=UPI002B2084E5|nr:hypothetical protein [Spirulina sp. 06S082]MEA5469585.1 hypothetical protein [Spirulina sp. 06S082]